MNSRPLLYTAPVRNTLQRPGFLIAFFALVFCVQVVPRWWSDSIVMDEEWEITAGYEYWKRGDVWTPFGSTASGSLPALPLLALDLQGQEFLSQFEFPARGIIFVFMENARQLIPLTVLARSVTLILCLLTLFLLAQCVRGSPWPEKAAALTLWAFDPTWVALGGTAKSDCAGAMWMLLLVLFFNRAQQKGSRKAYLATGVLCAIATTCRHTNFSAPLILLALEAAYWIPRSLDLKNKGAVLNLLSRWAVLAGGYLLWVGLVFLPGTFLEPKHLTPFHYYLEYLGHFTRVWEEVRLGPTFLGGGAAEGGGWLFFPYHFFFKSTLTFLALTGLSILLALRRVIRLESWIWIPAVVHLSLSWAVNPFMLPRHVLPASPFLILAAARAFQWLWEMSRQTHSVWVRAIPVLLLAWFQLGVAFQWPHALSYTNECMSRYYKPKYLSKFTWQTDQDVKRLAETGKRRGWTNVRFVSAGRIDPLFYGLPWEPFRSDELEKPREGCVYVVDTAVYQVAPVEAGGFTWWTSWLVRVPPTGRVSDTWFYYEVPGPTRPTAAFPYLPSLVYFKDGYPFYRPNFKPGNL